MKYDVFISHASEDKADIALPLTNILQDGGLKVWIDEFELTIGDSLRRKIDQGLAQSNYGVVILSPNFFLKEWTNKELDGLVAREDGTDKVILPIWHNINKSEIIKYSPTLADKVAVSTSKGLKHVANQIISAVNNSSSKSIIPISKEYKNEVADDKANKNKVKVNAGGDSFLVIGNNSNILINQTGSVWDKFDEPAKSCGWRNIIQLYRTEPPSIEREITYEEAKARSVTVAEKGDFYQAIALAELALRKKSDDYHLAAKIGEYFIAKGDYNDAHNAKLRAIKLLKSQSMVFNKFANEAAILYLELGNTNERRKEYEQALYAYDQADFYAIESENQKVLDDIAAKRAIFSTTSVGIKETRASYIRAKEQFGKYSEQSATKANNLALAYQRSGDYNNAEHLFLEVIENLKNLNLVDSIKLGMAYVNLAALHEEQAQFNKADIYFIKMLEIFGESESKIAFNAFFNCTKTAITQGNKARAFENLQRAIKYLNLLPTDGETKDCFKDLEKIKKNIEALPSE